MDRQDELQRQYLEGEMNPADRAAFLAGLPEPDRSELEALLQVMEQLEALPSVEVPEGLFARIETAIAAEPAFAPARQPWFARLTEWLKAPPTWGWSAAGLSAAMVLMLLVGPLHRHSTVPQMDALKAMPPMDAMATPARIAASQPAVAAPGSGTPVTFKFYAPQAQCVAVIGEFNGWGAQPAAVLKRQPNGQWQGSVPLPPGQYQYAFLVNGRQVMTDPQAMAYVQDDYGHRNAVLTLL